MICLRKRGGVVMSEDVHRRGKTIDEIKEGDSLTVTESISDRDLLLLTGIITSSISKVLPGPGSDVVNLSTNFILPVYHDEMVTFSFEVIKVDNMKEVITISVEGENEDGDRVIDAVVIVKPPKIF